MKLGMLLATVFTLLVMGLTSHVPDVGTGLGDKISAPTFYKDVVPILQNKCQSCHRSGEAAPMALVTYEQTRPWAEKMADAVAMRMMPPWFADPRYGHFANDPSLSAEQIATIVAWAKAGAPAGDARDASCAAEVE